MTANQEMVLCINMVKTPGDQSFTARVLTAKPHNIETVKRT